jgi:hypothetical protein
MCLAADRLHLRSVREGTLRLYNAIVKPDTIDGTRLTIGWVSVRAHNKFSRTLFMTELMSGMNLTLFVPAALALMVMPGPVVLYIVARSVDQGRKAGLVSVVAAETGNLISAARAGRWLRSNWHYRRAERYLTGSVYIGLGVTAAFSCGNRE